VWPGHTGSGCARIRGDSLLAGGFRSCFGIWAPSVQTPSDARAKINREDLFAQLRERGEIRVIVGLGGIVESAPGGNSVADAIRERNISAAQTQFLAKFVGHHVRDIKLMRLHPFVTMTGDAATLNALFADPQVTSISEDRARILSLYDTPGVTRADVAWSDGYRGTGQTVAVIDTGVDRTHPFFTGKVVAEACFSQPASSASSPSVLTGNLADWSRSRR